MTEREIELYRKCTKGKKKKKPLDKRTYDDEHEYDNEINEDRYDY